MLTRLRNYALIGIALYAFYFLLSRHFIFLGFHDVELLRKKQLTLAYTFYSLKQTPPEETLRIEPLREAGIGELMVDRGLISQSELLRLEQRIDAAQ
jgi:hypothetical protein